MKKRFFPAFVSAVICGSILFSSCIGSFSLTNKFLAWNKTIDNKFVNELVFIAFHILPAYPIAVVADILVLNSIEFWSGENPVEAGIVKKVQGENGIYTVETLENGYQIQDENGEAIELIYNKEENTWNLVNNNTTTKLIKFTEDNNAIVYLPNGQEQKVELSAEGLLAFRQVYTSGTYLAIK